ncbi:pyrimidine-specific ribonucleoside hydrolase RihA-like [Anopheles cruzii]|uniref:pyrimidine-specific ribonucleoside hydrolase RihA-like n=1 Tax=Anopheles cruzii TaxID=68878 RepID=UPI0022EC3516|nr:pyrimidine-specific ribonucleoside hydrolase RihA-like [Anopheles cruzii]
MKTGILFGTLALAWLMVALVGGSALASKCPRNAGVRRVILDVDAGGDDAWALILLLMNEERYNICVEAVTCTHGNAAVTDVAVNVLRILEGLNRLDVPVFLGAAESLITSTANGNDSLHFWGKNGFANVEFDSNPSTGHLESVHAVQKMYELFTLHPNKITLLAVGPLTNVALLFRMYPEVRSKIEALYILGGNRHGVGNTALAAEFNFYNDPEAANIVLSSWPKIVNVVPWETVDLLGSAFLTQWRFDTFAETTNPAIKVLNRIEAIVYAGHTEWTPCDMYVAAIFLNASISTSVVTHRAEVELNGRVTRGMMAILHHIKDEEQHNVAIIDRIDDDQVRRMMVALNDFPKKLERSRCRGC